ncbi:hypothetical protein [Actinocrispum sp. NPDC049592]|uniref:hypothetical protein n=1 Tax=Actinocrispum sp. NPDC049592 TaxID=3154835 RepID=UPI0034122090
MTVEPDKAIAAFDSASAMLAATSRGLTGQPFDRAGKGPLFGATLRAANLLPRPIRQRLYAFAGGAEGVTPEQLGEIDMGAVAEWVTGHYPAARYPGLLLGSSNGAAVHLATALGMPWLPQTLLIPVRWRGNDPGRPDRALDFGATVAPALLRRNNDIALHHMHDANQDRLMIGQMAYFRVKRQRLGDAYERFIRDRLAADAPIIVLADESTWPVSNVAERHVFQVGAQGGIGPEDYDRHGIVPDDESPEAEWGFDSALLDDVHRIAAETGHPVHVVRYPEPHALSGPVANLYHSWLGTEHPRLLVESFLLIDPTRTLEAGLVALWTMFPVESAVRATVDHVQSAPGRYRSVHVGLFPHGVESKGIAMPSLWQKALPGVDFLGVDVHRYPADFAALTRYGAELRRLPKVGSPAPGTLPLDHVLAELDSATGLTLVPPPHVQQ